MKLENFDLHSESELQKWVTVLIPVYSFLIYPGLSKRKTRLSMSNYKKTQTKESAVEASNVQNSYWYQ